MLGSFSKSCATSADRGASAARVAQDPAAPHHFSRRGEPAVELRLRGCAHCARGARARGVHEAGDIDAVRLEALRSSAGSENRSLAAGGSMQFSSVFGMLRRGCTAAVAVLAIASCGARTYELSFVCSSQGGPSCPPAQPCPEVPLGAGGCEDLPGLFDQRPTKVDKGRPIGCVVMLPYGNPYYGDSQQNCTCERRDSMATSAAWLCPI